MANGGGDQLRLSAWAELPRVLLDALPASVAWKGRDLRYLGCNRAFAEDAGLATPADIAGRTDHELPWRERAAARCLRDLEVLSSGEEQLDEPEPFPGPDGALLWRRTRRRPLRDEAGEPAGVLYLCEDLTGLRRAAEALATSEARFQAIIDTLPYPFFVKGADLRYSACNPAFERFLGLERQAILGRTVYEVSEREKADVYHRADLELLQGSGTQTYETRVRFADGQDRDVVFHKGVIRAAGGEAAGMLGIYFDVTDRKRAEQALRRSQRVVENSPVMLFGWGPAPDHRLEMVSQNVVHLGYRAEELLAGTPSFPELIHPEDRARVEREVWMLEENGERLRLEFRMVARDGRTRWVESNALVERDARGRALGAQGILLDVTERREAEEARWRLEEQLRHAQKMESIGRLAGGIAHDLNNLLSPILGYSELLLGQLPPGARAHEEAGEIHRAAERARDLIRRLLAFSRKQVLELKPVDLRDVVRGFAPMLRRTIREDIHLELSLPSALAPVSADAGQIELVLMNLAVNAQDAMPGGGSLRLSLADVPAPAGGPGQVLLEVSDTGCGMDAATLARIFEPFFTTKPVGQGTGLGLSTVYGIVQQHRGQVEVRSTVGAGTTLRILLPATEAAPAPVAAPPARTPARPPAAGTVLVVEDNDTIRRMTRLVLESEGYRVLVADCGERALAVAAAEPGGIDLLLSDVIMPDLDGVKLYGRLREVRPGLKALFMSGYDADVVTRQGVVPEGLDFLQKPFSLDALAARVRAALAG